MRRLRARVAGWGALVLVGVAWLAGPVPGFDGRGVTGQPTGDLWWWQLAAGVLVAAAAAGAVRTGDVSGRIDRGSLRAWRPGQRWRTVVVVAWLVLAVLAAAHLADGTGSWGDVVTPAAAAAILVVAPRRSVGGAAVPRLAVGVLVLAGAAILAAGVAIGGGVLDQPAAFYALKQQVRAPVAAHNVLAGFLLVGAPAVAIAAVRRPRRWAPALGFVGLGLAATLSRGAVLAGVVAAVVARVGTRDRAVAARTGIVTLVGAIGIGGALWMLGAPVQDAGGPTSTVARVELWQAAVEVVGTEPATGVGPDGFLAATRARDLAAPHEHAHDLPLHAAATLGVPGLLAEAAVWIGIAAGAAGMLDRDRRTVVLTALAGLGALALVDEVAMRPATVGLLALLATVVAAPRDRHVVTAVGP